MSYKTSIPALVRISFLIVLLAGWCLSKNCTKDDVFVDIYPGDCRKYIECKHGKEEVKKCDSSSTHKFDHKLLKCVSVWPNKVDCESPSPWEKTEAAAGPVHNEPVHNEPVHNEPVHNEPVHNKPVHKEPIYVPTIIEPVEHPIHNEKPTEKPAQKPGEKPAEKPAGKPAEKPAGIAPTVTTSTHQPTAPVAPAHNATATPTKPSHPTTTTSTVAPTKHSTQRVTSIVSNPGHKHESTTIPSVTVTTPKNTTKKNGSPSSTSVSIITLVVLILTVGFLR